MGKVVTMPARKRKLDTSTPWGALGFDSERDMLIDDLRDLNGRIKSPSTTATAVAALSKRKHEVLEQIKALDSADDPESILDSSDDEAWDGS
ncbi:MAG TPA: hypothetical protein VGF17_03920 [Phytomonospora sp.]|nr:hypothetical protein [Dermatophilaceae bacterium]